MISDPDDLPDDENVQEDVESKSQRKRNAHQITELASQLVEMKPRALASLPIEQSTRDAINHCAEIRAHGARKRQLHFVSKLLREGENIQELQAILERPDLSPKTKSGTNPHLEFRDKLIHSFSDHVDDLREQYPKAELQQVRQLVRNAHSESKKAERKEASSKTDEDPGSVLKPQNTKAAKSLLKLLSNS